MDNNDMPLAEKYIQYLKNNDLLDVTVFARNRTKLAERYFKYSIKHYDDFNQIKIAIKKQKEHKNNKEIYEQRLLNNQELAKELNGRYINALMTIKPEYRACELVDMNLCFRSLTDNSLDFLSPVHFDNDVLNDIKKSTVTAYESYPHKPTLYFDSWEAFEENEKNGTPTYSFVPPNNELYDEYYKIVKKERLCIKKSYSQYKIIKEYLTLEKKIKKYENLIELCDKIPILYDSPIQNINTDHVMNIFLYGLTDGRLYKFYELARFCAKIADAKAKNKAFAIYADPTIYDALILFLGAATNKLLKPCSFKTLWKKEALLNLQKASMNNSNVGYVCIDEPIPDTVAKAKILKKILKGNIITVKDKYYPVDLRIINRIPIIYLTNNKEYFNKIKNIFSATAIEFNSEKIAMPHISQQALFWLQNDFISLGVHNIKEVEKYPQKSEMVTEDEIIEDFIESVCILDDDFNCPIKEVYSAYCNYYKKYYGKNPLTPIKFTKQFAAVSNLQKYRPHYKGKSNVYYFKGIKIDETKNTPLPIIASVKVKTNSIIKNEDRIETKTDVKKDIEKDTKEDVKENTKKKKKKKSDSEKKYPTKFSDFCKDIISKQFQLYQQQIDNMRIFNYQQNMEE